MKFLLPIIFVFCAGCFEVVNHDPQTLKNIQDSIRTNEDLKVRVDDLVAFPTSQKAEAIKELLSADTLRLQAWELEENAKKVD